MRISDWSSDVGSSDLQVQRRQRRQRLVGRTRRAQQGLEQFVVAAGEIAHRRCVLVVEREAQLGHLPGRKAELPGERAHQRRRVEIDRDVLHADRRQRLDRSEEHTSELQSLMRISYAVFCLKKKKKKIQPKTTKNTLIKYKKYSQCNSKTH